MAKKKKEAEVAPTIDERVAEVFSEPEPGTEPDPQSEVETADVTEVAESVREDEVRQVIPPPRPAPEAPPAPAPKSVKETWQEEAAHVLRLLEMGDAVSPGELRRLLHQAVGLVG